MGYTSLYVGQTAETNKTLMTRELERGGHIKVLKSAVVNGVYYGAYTSAKENGKVHAIVCLMRKRNGEFIYKDMDEDMGPFESKCPMSIISMLSPTESEYANQWRARCVEYATSGAKSVRKQLNDLPIGTRILANGEHHCIKCRPCYGKKKQFFMLEGKFAYLPITRITRFEVVQTA